MAKVPELGRVKTRLGRDVGSAHATRVYRSVAAAVLGRLAADRRFETTLAMAPDTGVASAAAALASVPSRFGQGEGDLGRRLQRAAALAGRGPVAIIGTDIPSVTASLVVEAFRKLADADAVFGPADDGGYWLVGFRNRRLAMLAFRNVRWSTSHALADTRANLRGFTIAETRTLSDLDTRHDLRRLDAQVGRRVLPALPLR
jgi:hypothetical protein